MARPPARLPEAHAASETIVSRVRTPNIQFLGTTFAIMTTARNISVAGSRNIRMRALASASLAVIGSGPALRLLIVIELTSFASRWLIDSGGTTMAQCRAVRRAAVSKAGEILRCTANA